MLPDDIKGYIGHIGNCGAVGSDDPMDGRCICGLRSVWARRVLTAPPCKQCDLSMTFHDCPACEGQGGWWNCTNVECPA